MHIRRHLGCAIRCGVAIMQTVAVAEHIGLGELKARAKLDGYTKIKCLVEDAPAVSLERWKGVTSDVGSGYFHVGVSYGLSNDTVVAHKRGEPDIYYLLS